MKKTNNNNKKSNRRPTVVADIYRDMYTGQQMPITEAFFERLAVDYVNWVKKNKRAIRYTQFSNEMGIPRTSFQRWCQTKQPLIEAHEIVMSIIADRREVGMTFGEQREKCNMYMMHRYDHDWKEADQRWAELHAKANQKENQPTTQFIVLDKFPETNIVPKKIENKEGVVVDESRDEDTLK